LRSTENVRSDQPRPLSVWPIEVIDIIEGFGLGFCLGNVVKYVLRHKQKAGIEDLKKARWYLDRQIQQMEKAASE